MRSTQRFAPALAACVLTACLRAQAPLAHRADLRGDWALAAWEYSGVTAPAERTDWVRTEALSGRLTLSENGALALTLRLPGGFGGDGDSLRLAPPLSAADWRAVTVRGDTLTLVRRELEPVALRDGEVPVPARLALRFVRAVR